MGTIFLFHSSRPFAPPPWHVMNSTLDLGFTLFDAFISGWIMPLFFVISGIAVYSSLRKRSGSASQFLKDRFMRLMIPFLTVGLLVILSVNVYYDAVFHGNFTGDFLSFYLGPYFTKFFPFDLNFSSTYFAELESGHIPLVPLLAVRLLHRDISLVQMAREGSEPREALEAVRCLQQAGRHSIAGDSSDHCEYSRGAALLRLSQRLWRLETPRIPRAFRHCLRDGF